MTNEDNITTNGTDKTLPEGISLAIFDEGPLLNKSCCAALATTMAGISLETFDEGSMNEKSNDDATASKIINEVPEDRHSFSFSDYDAANTNEVPEDPGSFSDYNAATTNEVPDDRQSFLDYDAATTDDLTEYIAGYACKGRTMSKEFEEKLNIATDVPPQLEFRCIHIRNQPDL